jgi:hypothetical protein
MHDRPFQPVGGQTVVIANATTAAAATLFSTGSEYAFYNSSATAIAFIRMTSTPIAGDPAAVATITTDMPIPPGALIRLSFGVGRKSLTAIASAADGNLYVTPGHGN